MVVATFAALFIALYVGHHVGDQWVQTHHQALTKGGTGDRTSVGRAACFRHVLNLSVTQLAAVGAVVTVLQLDIPAWRIFLGVAVNAASHFWADRIHTLEALARKVNKGGYWDLGGPRPGHDDNITVGTGRYHLDQSWHLAWVFVSALAMVAGLA
jgi:hypothetical protein